MEQTFLSSFLIITLVGILGAISPGPDFVIVTKNSLMFSKRAGLYTALGVALAVSIHIAYCLIGIGFFIAESPFLFNMIKYSGAAYLIYIGIQGIWSTPTIGVNLDIAAKNQDLPPLKALQTGFLTNALNPKATLFFLSVFSQVINPETPLVIQLIYALEIQLIVLGWFCLLAFLLSHPKLKSRIVKIQPYIEKGMGGLLIAFGLKIAFV